MFLAMRIKESRLKQNLTQQELGDLLKVSKVSVCLWEKGVKKPSSKNLLQLSKVLNVPLEYLIGNDSYVISEDNQSYGLMMAKEEIEILREIKKHDKLYKDFLDNPSRVIERIEKKLYWYK